MEEVFPEGLYFSVFRFYFECDREVQFPFFTGSMIRGIFGRSLKEVVCLRKEEKNCNQCFLLEKCVYPYIFEGYINPERNLGKDTEKIPHPYVISPLKAEGKTLIFDLVLIGKAIDHLEYLIYSFIQGGEKYGLGKDRINFRVERVENINVQNLGKEIYNRKENKVIRNNLALINADSFPLSDVNFLKIYFLTPTRIKANGKYGMDFSFSDFLVNLYRRLVLLRDFHCSDNKEKKIIRHTNRDNVQVFANNLYRADWERYSNRQKRKILMYSFMGSISFSGDLSPFIPLISMGQFVHTGNGSSFGMGKYKVEFGKI